MEYRFREYKNDDYEFVYRLKKQAYIDYVVEYWGRWDENQQINFFNEYINKQAKFIKIIIFKGMDIGFFDANIVNDYYEINNICIDENFRGQGIGSKILEEAIKQHDNFDIKLQCFKSNPVIKLYERLGFIKDSETETHIKLIKRK